MLIAVNFHYVRDAFPEPHPGIHGKTTQEFHDQLVILKETGTFVGQEQLLDAIQQRKPLPDKSLVITFDDGLQEQIDNALPVLNDLGIPALFFVNTYPVLEEKLSLVHKTHLVRAHTAPDRLEEILSDIAGEKEIPFNPDTIDNHQAQKQYQYDTGKVARLKYLLNFQLNRSERKTLIQKTFERRFDRSEQEMANELYMGKEDLKTLAKKGYLGTHAHRHQPLGDISVDRMKHLIDRSCKLLEEWTGKKPRAISYPYGGFEACSESVADYAEQQGIALGFTMERAGNPDLKRPLLLARCACNDVPGGKNPRWSKETLFSDIPTPKWFSN